MVEVIEAGFGVEVLGLEAERGFGCAGLGDEVAVCVIGIGDLLAALVLKPLQAPGYRLHPATIRGWPDRIKCKALHAGEKLRK